MKHKLTLYELENSEIKLLEIAPHVAMCIPLTQDAIDHMIGKHYSRGEPVLVAKGKAVEEIMSFQMENPDCFEVYSATIKPHAFEMLFDMMDRCDTDFSIGWKHPYMINDTSLTFMQLVSAYALFMRNLKEGNSVKFGWAMDKVLGAQVSYQGGGGIFIGIEPCGYAHS